MSDVKRFDFSEGEEGSYATMYECADGEYVRFDDFKAALDRLHSLVSQAFESVTLGELRDWIINNVEPDRRPVAVETSVRKSDDFVEACEDALKRF